MPQYPQPPALPQPAPYQAPDPQNPYPLDPSHWDHRADGSAKGEGFLGPLLRPDGRALSSEISISTDDFGGAEIPTVVPTLTKRELEFLLQQDFERGFKMPDSIVRKAVDFARQRQAAGKPYFAQPGEENIALYPHIRRAGQPASINQHAAMYWPKGDR